MELSCIFDSFNGKRARTVCYDLSIVARFKSMAFDARHRFKRLSAQRVPLATLWAFYF
jgi:hypothetical protein